MMLPPLPDFLALLGIDLALCAAALQWLGRQHSRAPSAKWLALACFSLLWIPAGEAHLPLLAYVRGISSDVSITLVALAVLLLGQRLLGWKSLAQREYMALNALVAAAALLLYPLALGWGDWDAYRPGWGAPGMWAALMAISLVCWLQGLRLVPLLIGLALTAWSLGLMESANLWDYLLDPWLALIAIFQCLRWATKQALARLKPKQAAAGEGLP
jgi:hypothetical protein